MDYKERVKHMLQDLHDEVLYTTKEYKVGTLGNVIDVYQSLKSISESDELELSDEAKNIIKRVEFDLSGLEGIEERVKNLYQELTGVDVLDSNTFNNLSEF